MPIQHLEPPRRTTLLGGLLLAAMLGLTAGASRPAAHGSVYRGPGGTVPPGPAPGGPTSPGGASSAGGATGDETSWTTWWAYRRDPYLQLKSAVHAAGTISVGGGFSLGRGEQFDSASALRPGVSTLRERVLPALLAALEESPSVDMQSACLMALAKMGEAPEGQTLGDVLAGHLTSPNQEVAETAALALGVSGEERSLFLLADLLDDNASGRRRLGGKAVPIRTRAFAAYGLGFGGARSPREDVRRFVVSRLAAVLGRERFAARDVPVAVVQSIGLVPLALASGPSSPGTQESPASSRGAQVRYLLGLLDDKTLDAATRAHVPGTLGALLEDVEGIPDGRQLKEFAARSLLELLDPLTPLAAELRQAAVIGLQFLADGDGDDLDREIAEQLERTARSADFLTRCLALIAIGDSSARDGAGPEPQAGLESGHGFLLERLSAGSSLTRPWAALGLAVGERRRRASGHAESRDVAQALRGAASEANSPEERAGMALASGLCNDPLAAQGVLELFSGPGSDDVRGYFALALGLLRSRAATEALTQTVQRSRFRPGLLRDSAVGLALIGDKSTSELLARELSAAGSLASQEALTTALAVVGDARTIEPLLAHMADPANSARSRAFAAAALGGVADRRSLPFQSMLARRVLWRSAPETLIDPAGRRGLLDLF